jgi:hypothetical protein
MNITMILGRKNSSKEDVRYVNNELTNPYASKHI